VQFKRFILCDIEVVREQDEESKIVRQAHDDEGDCGAMKMVILITVIESLVVTLAIMYFYYRRSQSRKRALVLRRGHVSITKQTKFVLRNQSGHSHDI